jgi:hypothetical protein
MSCVLFGRNNLNPERINVGRILFEVKNPEAECPDVSHFKRMLI